MLLGAAGRAARQAALGAVDHAAVPEHDQRAPIVRSERHETARHEQQLVGLREVESHESPDALVLQPELPALARVRPERGHAEAGRARQPLRRAIQRRHAVDVVAREREEAAADDADDVARVERCEARGLAEVVRTAHDDLTVCEIGEAVTRERERLRDMLARRGRRRAALGQGLG